MDIKIQELTEKIYLEGVEKGNEEAAKIIAEANTKKQSMLSEAEAEAKQILALANKQAAEMKKNTEAELKMFAAQALEALKSEVTNLITGEVVSTNVKAALADKTYMQKVMLEMVQNWTKNESLTILAPTESKLDSYFKSNAKELLSKGLKIETVNGKDCSFTIVPADGSYKVSFGEEEFISYFKEYLRPQLVQMLF